jgi:hypothetical protein
VADQISQRQPIVRHAIHTNTHTYHRQGNNVAQDYRTNFITEHERDCPRPRPGWPTLRRWWRRGHPTGSWPRWPPSFAIHRASCIGQDGRSDAARCSNDAASHCTNLTGATAAHVRREWTRRAVTQPTHSPLIALVGREEANFCCALCMRDETGRRRDEKKAVRRGMVTLSDKGAGRWKMQIDEPGEVCLERLAIGDATLFSVWLSYGAWPSAKIDPSSFSGPIITCRES